MLNLYYNNYRLQICDSKSDKIATNGLGLCDGGAIEAQIFNFAQKLNRRITVNFAV